MADRKTLADGISAALAAPVRRRVTRAKHDHGASSAKAPPDTVAIDAHLSAFLAETNSPDRFTSRARPGFLYVMYVMLLWALPMGVLSAFDPDRALAVTKGMEAYLGSLPEPLYALFGTGYLGYTVARQWGKVAGVDR